MTLFKWVQLEDVIKSILVSLADYSRDLFDSESQVNTRKLNKNTSLDYLKAGD